MTPRRLARSLTALALLILAALTSIACATVASPEGWASPVLGDGVLLVAHRDELLALDPETLQPRWSFPAEAGEEDLDPIALYGTPAVAGGTVFVPTYDGTLYALDATSGELRWQPYETDGALIGGVAASQDTIYFGSSDGQLYALDAASGEPRWPAFETDEPVWSTPVLAGDTLYVTSLDGRLYALEAATGVQRWFFETGAGVASPPAVNEAAGLVYVGGFDGRLRAIDLETHEERWALKAGNWFWTEPLVADGALYAGSLDGKVYAVDAVTGAPRWPRPFSTEGPVRAAPVFVGGVLIVVDRDGNVYGIRPEDGSAAVGTPLALDADVLADPLVVSRAASAQGQGGDEVLVVTTGGDLVRIDPATLKELGRRKLTGD